MGENPDLIRQVQRHHGKQNPDQILPGPDLCTTTDEDRHMGVLRGNSTSSGLDRGTSDP
jgi:hypothetical protein